MAKKGRRRHGGDQAAAQAAAPDAPAAGAAQPGAASGDAGAAAGGAERSAHVLSANIGKMRFMHSAREEEERRQQEKQQLRHLEEMRWVVPGFEAEVDGADTEAEKRPREQGAAAPCAEVRLHRRSYKGFNPVVEQWAK
ncbi:unnamed protein product, partial [Prorocentrum cordatum]